MSDPGGPSAACPAGQTTTKSAPPGGGRHRRPVRLLQAAVELCAGCRCGPAACAAGAGAGADRCGAPSRGPAAGPRRPARRSVRRKLPSSSRRGWPRTGAHRPTLGQILDALHTAGSRSAGTPAALLDPPGTTHRPRRPVRPAFSVVERPLGGAVMLPRRQVECGTARDPPWPNALRGLSAPHLPSTPQPTPPRLTGPPPPRPPPAGREEPLLGQPARLARPSVSRPPRRVATRAGRRLVRPGGVRRRRQGTVRPRRGVGTCRTPPARLSRATGTAERVLHQPGDGPRGIDCVGDPPPHEIGRRRCRPHHLRPGSRHPARRRPRHPESSRRCWTAVRTWVDTQGRSDPAAPRRPSGARPAATPASRGCAGDRAAGSPASRTAPPLR